MKRKLPRHIPPVCIKCRARLEQEAPGKYVWAESSPGLECSMALCTRKADAVGDLASLIGSGYRPISPKARRKRAVGTSLDPEPTSAEIAEATREFLDAGNVITKLTAEQKK